MMNHEMIQEFQQFVIEHGLPKTDMALFGIRCPYCGKSDRIRQLEAPDQLREDMSPEEMSQYRALWMHLTQSKSSLGVCKFCHNALNLFLAEGKAEGLHG